MKQEGQDFRMQLHARYKEARARMHCDILEKKVRAPCRPTIRPSSPRHNPPSIAEIRQIVASFFGLTLDQLDSRSRQAPLLEARRAAMYFCVLVGHSRVKVGRAFAGRDHTSIIDALRKFEVKKDPALVEKLEALRITLGLAPAPKSVAAIPIPTENTSAPRNSPPNAGMLTQSQSAQKRRFKHVSVTARFFPDPAPGLREMLAEMKDVRPHVRTDDDHGFDGW